MLRSRMAPIAVFAFKRPDHLRRTLRSLKECEGFDSSEVTVYCDGPRSESDNSGVEAARAVALTELGPNANIRHALKNKGLFVSIVDGVNEQIERHGRVIVIEDDLQFSPQFLRFMNDGLDLFADHPRVYQISGYMFDVPELALRDNAVFLPMINSWGWATWDRAWRQFNLEPDLWRVMLADRGRRRRFNLGGAYDYATMLRHQLRVERSKRSWDVCWYFNVFNADGLVLYPPQSLVRNIGQDGTGSHGGGRFRNFSGPKASMYCGNIKIPGEPTETSSVDLKMVYNAIWQQNGGSIGAIVDLIKRIVRRR